MKPSRREDRALVPLAIEGGPAIRSERLPYGKHSVDAADIQAVLEVLQSDWLTTGPKVLEFEEAFAAAVHARYAVSVCNGTAALHAAVHAADLAPGDEIIVPALTFAATANAILYQNAIPVFVDVEPGTLVVDPVQVEAAITPRTKGIIGVDYAGRPCNYGRLGEIAASRQLILMSDSCHALGGTYEGRAVGSLADLSIFSFHPVKHITTGEGGMITTDVPELAQRMLIFRNHGISTDHRQRAEHGQFSYEMVELGYNYRLTDLQCALGLSQLRRLPEFVARRQAIARRYDTAFAGLPGVRTLAGVPETSHAYHLYPVLLELEGLRVGRSEIFAALRAEGIGVNVHYLPVYLHPYYSRRFGERRGLCPVAEDAYERLLSLPVFPAMTTADVDDVIAAVDKVIRHYGR